MRVNASRPPSTVGSMFGVCLLVIILVLAGCTTQTPPSTAVSVSLNPNAAQTAGQGVVIPITATLTNDTNSQGVTWTLTGAGALSGSTTTATTYTAPATINSASIATVTATSVKDTSKTAPLTINLAPISITLAPSSPTSVDQGKAVAITAALANDTNSQGVTWTLTGAGGGSLSGSTTTATTYNAPAIVPSATSVTVTATAVGNATITAPLIVNLVPPPAVTPAAINASIGVPYGPTALAMTGGVAPFTWSNPGADLPSWLTLNSSTGAVSGTPPQTGAFSFSAQVTDAMGLVSTVQLINVTVGVATSNACGTTPGGHESFLKGEYAFYVQGYDGAGAPIALAASFNADGTGKVTAGDEDSTISTGSTHVTINAAGSSYVVGPDNRGCVTLVDSAPASVPKTFRFALGGLSGAPAVASKGSIMEFDDATGTNSRASGVIRLQTTSAFAIGQFQTQYAFGMDGFNTAGHYDLGGSFTISKTTGVISALFSDFDDAGNASASPAATGNSGGTGSLTLPVSTTTGRVQGSINDGAGHTYNLAIYVVKPDEFFAVTTNTLSATQPILSGRIIVTNSSLFTLAGAAGTDLIHVNGTVVGVASPNSPNSPNGTIGILTFTAGGAVTGTLYSYDSGSIPPVQLPQLLSTTYTVDPASGRVALAAGSNSPAVYVATTTDGISAFIIGLDNSAFFGYGEAQPPAVYTNASVSGTYTIGFDQMIDNGLTNTSGAAVIASGTIASGTLDFSGPFGLTINSPTGSPSFTINSDGTGTWDEFSSATTFVVTNGTKLFVLDDTSGVAEIYVFEK